MKDLFILIKKIYRNFRTILYYYGMNRKKCKKDILCAELIRNTHSIEKGLSIEEFRPFFGQEKIKEMITILNELNQTLPEKTLFYKEAIEMGYAALASYLCVHEMKEYSSDFLDYIRENVSRVSYDKNKGGTIVIKKNDEFVSNQLIETFFSSRHSIRDFSGEPIEDCILKKALKMAKSAPSACNRQAVRAYVLGRMRTKEIAKEMPEIGGFANNVDRFIIITGKTSAYRYDEDYQFVVSASIYAGYLSLTLHACGLGSCIIQRALTYNRKWKSMQLKYHVPEDEQIVCLIAVGNLKDETVVPISHRICNDETFVFISD